MRAKTYFILETCVEKGIKLGISRAYKHTDNPQLDVLAEKVKQAIMEEVREWFDFTEAGE